MARIAVVATTDLVSDQRVHRTALTLSKRHEVVAYGRWLPLTTDIPQRDYQISLLRMLFGKGMLFYAEFNLRIFFLLLFSPVDMVYSNDLDTLLACKLACFIKRKPLVFDAHELFSELPELVGRSVAKRVWQLLERLLIPRCKHCITVSEGVADEFMARYGVTMQVVRNVPFAKDYSKTIPREDNTIIYQGALNMGRGLEMLIESIAYLPNHTLLIAGEGDLSIALRELVQNLDIESQVHFLGRLPLELLSEQTARASLGVSLEEDLGLNYRFALPNKLFDYIQMRVPVLVSSLPDMSNLVHRYDIGLTSTAQSAQELAAEIESAFSDANRYNLWKRNLEVAAQELCWEKELHKMVEVVDAAMPSTL